MCLFIPLRYNTVYRNQDNPEKRDKTMWKIRWEEATNATEWMKTLISNLDIWLKCKHRKVNNFHTQFLCGHVLFRMNTKRRKSSRRRMHLLWAQRHIGAYCFFVHPLEHWEDRNVTDNWLPNFTKPTQKNYRNPREVKYYHNINLQDHAQERTRRTQIEGR